MNTHSRARALIDRCQSRDRSRSIYSSEQILVYDSCELLFEFSRFQVYSHLISERYAFKVDKTLCCLKLKAKSAYNNYYKTLLNYVSVYIIIFSFICHVIGCDT